MNRNRSKACGRRSLSLMLGSILALSTAWGCSWMPHEQRVEKAQQHWSRVRAAMKVQLAEQQFSTGHIDAAVKTLDEAMSFSPDYAAGYILLAQCRLEQGKASAAGRAAHMAAKLDPNDPSVESLLGLLCERRDDYAAALEHYQRARLLDDTVIAYLMAEAECLVALDRADEAVDLLRNNLNAYDNDPALHALLAEISLRQGEQRKALNAFRSALAEGSEDPLVSEQYGLLAARLGMHAEALNALEPIEKSNGESTSTSVLRALANCQFALDRPEAAKRELARLIARDPSDLESWRLLARAGVQTGDLGMMRRAAANIHRLAPGDAHGLLIQAYANIRDGEYDAARATLETLVDTSPNDLLVHCMLAHVQQRCGHASDAALHYRRALEIDPQCVWAKAALQKMNDPDNLDAAPRSTDAGTSTSVLDSGVVTADANRSNQP